MTKKFLPAGGMTAASLAPVSPDPGPAKTGLSVHHKPLGSFSDFSFEDMAQITLDAIGDGVLVVDPQSKVIYLNRMAEMMTGWSSEQAIGRPVEQVFFIFDGVTRERVMNPGQRAIDEGQIVVLALGSVLIRRDGTDIAIEDSAAPIHNSEERVVGAVIVFHNATQSSSEIQKMRHLAQHDFLTGLPNRMLFRERLTQAVAMAHRRNKQMALLFLDLNYFKEINDTFGHKAGDHLLQEVAREITDCVRTTDTVSRHGGDEFVMLLTEINERQDAVHIAEKLLSRFAAPRRIDGNEIQVSLSIGISVYPENGLDADILLHNADVAMYTTKKKRQGSRVAVSLSGP